MSNDPISSRYSDPKPQLDYQQIIQNPDIFFEKLQAFHIFNGAKFRVPTLGGNRLDLHRFFLEVTSRGGIEQVIKNRRWKEIAIALNFPSTLTSASFVLRRYYLSLLYQFEQVYYLQKKESSIAEIDEANMIIYGSKSPSTVGFEAATDQFTVSCDEEDGSFVTGTIDEKFDSGYLVTVNFGAETLKGVLYHTPVEPNAPSRTISSCSDPARGVKRKYRMALRGPSHPKRNRSGYTFFFAEHYHRLRPLYHGQERSISKKIGQLWNKLTEAEKLVYQEKGLRDKERYKVEMIKYKSSQHASS